MRQYAAQRLETPHLSLIPLEIKYVQLLRLRGPVYVSYNVETTKSKDEVIPTILKPL